MSNDARGLQRYLVAMTVLVEAEGRDHGDATNVAWRALQEVIAAGEQAFAATEGALVVRPAASITART